MCDLEDWRAGQRLEFISGPSPVLTKNAGLYCFSCLYVSLIRSQLVFHVEYFHPGGWKWGQELCVHIPGQCKFMYTHFYGAGNIMLYKTNMFSIDISNCFWRTRSQDRPGVKEINTHTLVLSDSCTHSTTHAHTTTPWLTKNRDNNPLYWHKLHFKSHFLGVILGVY